MMRFIKISVVIVIIGFLSWGLFNLDKQSRGLKAKIKDLEANAANLEKENQTFKSNIDYYSRSENLIKELKSLFNYREPEEKMIIIPNKNENQ